MTEYKADIGIICAMEVEMDEIQSSMTDCRCMEISGITFVYGTLCDKKVAAAVCGVGKVFAALCTEAMILTFHPCVVVNSGVAGGLSQGLTIGDAAIAKALVQHDMDTSPLGDPVGMVSGINVTYFPCDDKAASALKAAALSLGIHTECGVIASGDQFISSDEKKQAIKETFGAIACEMEGAAVAHVCYVNGIACAVLRTISDGGDEAASVDFPAFVKAASHNSCQIMKQFVREYCG